MPNIFVEALIGGQRHRFTTKFARLSSRPSRASSTSRSSPRRRRTSPARRPGSRSGSPPPTRSHSWVRRWWPSMTRPSNTSRAVRMYRISRKSSGNGSDRTSPRPSRASTDGLKTIRTGRPCKTWGPSEILSRNPAWRRNVPRRLCQAEAPPMGGMVGMGRDGRRPRPQSVRTAGLKIDQVDRERHAGESMVSF